jgi:spore coat protein A
MKFDMPSVGFNVPPSTRPGVPQDGNDYHEYVWHCHILEHEEHDMMRPLLVRPAQLAIPAARKSKK